MSFTWYSYESYYIYKYFTIYYIPLYYIIIDLVILLLGWETPDHHALQEVVDKMKEVIYIPMQILMRYFNDDFYILRVLFNKSLFYIFLISIIIQIFVLEIIESKERQILFHGI